MTHFAFTNLKFLDIAANTNAGFKNLAGCPNLEQVNLELESHRQITEQCSIMNQSNAHVTIKIVDNYSNEQNQETFPLWDASSKF